MEIQPLPYDAEALARFAREGPYVWLWEPRELGCVLGAGTPATDVNRTLCAESGVPVYRRKGGGGAVVLSPGNLVITACYEGSRRTFATQWMEPVTAGIVRALAGLGVRDLAVHGMGDVVLGERKILGSSLYANRHVVLYQGSLLWDPDLELIQRYLPHPSSEPEYRRGRSHREFVTSLGQAGQRPEWPQLVAALTYELDPARL